MLGINAVKGFEYGEGFAGVTARGSEQNDVFIPKADAAETPADAAVNQDIAARITTKSNHSGGIQGGLSNGQDIYFRVAFKPVATLLMEQNTVDLEGNATTLLPAAVMILAFCQEPCRWLKPWLPWLSWITIS